MDVTTHRTARPDHLHAEATPVVAPFSGTLDDLLALDAGALETLYRGARVPRLADVKGDLRGRMLAVVELPQALAGAVRAFAGSSAFPWRGKSFSPLTADRGEGVNRVISDSWRLFTFGTFVGPSRAGAFDAVQLDYDRPSNPFFIRAIKDEIRELRPGLWLGQAWLKTKSSERLVLYFGLTSDGK
ncbi:MAG TPA: hypothetical protein VFF06_12655 [Polyangia bacterium]|nr:hypothetical protein [Polyangia bacterium]